MSATPWMDPVLALCILVGLAAIAIDWAINWLGERALRSARRGRDNEALFLMAVATGLATVLAAATGVVLFHGWWNR